MNDKKTSPGIAGSTRFLAFLYVACLGFMNGCATSSLPQELVQRDHAAFSFGPGDEVSVRFFYVPDLNEIQTVRPDGMISLQLIGDVQAANRTPEELRGILFHKYSGLIEKPDVSVAVRRIGSRSVMVGGSVLRPGRLDMPGELTALEAIMQAGGLLLDVADPGRVVVLRLEDGHYKGFTLDIRQALKGRSHEVAYLHSQDIVYVPRTGIANLNQWIDQYINSVIPQFGLRITKTSGDMSYTLDTTDYRR